MSKNVCLLAIQKGSIFHITNCEQYMFVMFRLVICLTMYNLQFKEIVLKMYRKHMYTHGDSLSIGTHTPWLYMNAHMFVCIFTRMHPFFVYESKQYIWNVICSVSYWLNKGNEVKFLISLSHNCPEVFVHDHHLCLSRALGQLTSNIF